MKVFIRLLTLISTVLRRDRPTCDHSRKLQDALEYHSDGEK